MTNVYDRDSNTVRELLNLNGFNVELVRETNHKTPDLLVTDAISTYLIEVKSKNSDQLLIDLLKQPKGVTLTYKISTYITILDRADMIS